MVDPFLRDTYKDAASWGYLLWFISFFGIQYY